MSEFKVGDLIKNTLTGGFAEVLFATEQNTFIKYIHDGDKGYSYDYSEHLLSNEDAVKKFVVANAEWKVIQKKDKFSQDVGIFIDSIMVDIKYGRVVVTNLAKTINPLFVDGKPCSKECVVEITYREAV